MDFSFTEEQQMLLDTTRRFIAERYDFDYRNSVRSSGQGWSSEVWSQLAELGLLSANVPEDDGGIGAGPVGTLLVSNAVGEGMLLEPFLSSAVIATHAIATMGDTEQRARWLPALASGETIAVLAHEEASTRHDPANIETMAATDGDGWRLSGRKTCVYHAPAAQLLLVSARLEGGGIGLFTVPAGADGVALRAFKTVDEQVAADLTLDSVQVAADARLGEEAGAALQDVLDYGLAALCGEAFGAMDRILAATIEYSRSRVQFGQPIGRFQALQHRMAEMLMNLEQARSMTFLATAQCMNPDRMERRAALSAAKVLMGQAARYIGQQAVQLHGGMGMTDELNVSHYFKRLLAFELRSGTTDEHLESYRLWLQAT